MPDAASSANAKFGSDTIRASAFHPQSRFMCAENVYLACKPVGSGMHGLLRATSSRTLAWPVPSRKPVFSLQSEVELEAVNPKTDSRPENGRTSRKYLGGKVLSSSRERKCPWFYCLLQTWTSQEAGNIDLCHLSCEDEWFFFLESLCICSRPGPGCPASRAAEL